MNSRLHRSIASSFVHAPSLCLGLILASISPAFSDQAATLADAIARAYDPKQISALVATAAGRVETGPDMHTPSLESLEQTLAISDDVAVALLRVLDRASITPDRLANNLAEATIQYHAVLDFLAEMNVYDPTEANLVKQVQAAMTAGRFSDAEADLRQIEDREVAASGRSTGASTALDEHRLVAAQARTLLGTISLMKLEYGEAAENFLLSRQRLSPVPSDQPGMIQPQPITAPEVADTAEPLQDRVAVTDVPRPIDGNEPTEARALTAAPPAIAYDEATVAPKRTAMALMQPTATTPAQPDRSKSAGAPITEAMAKPPSVVANLSSDVLRLLLGRGDAMLALGDFTSARLLYARAASAGDVRGVTGVAKTYDPSVLSQIGSRGIQADPVAAAVWYRRALDLGDASAAAPLKLLDQAR